MRNRAKCRLCQDIIESFHSHDYVSCKCGEISIDGGNLHYKASAKDFKNFLRVDDEGHEIEVKVEDKAPIISEQSENISEVTLHGESLRPNKQELIQMLDEMRKRYENLPQEAFYAPITHADFTALMMLLTAVFKAD